MRGHCQTASSVWQIRNIREKASTTRHATPDSTVRLVGSISCTQRFCRAGRGGNTWTSPPGCLMFSLLTRLQIDGAPPPPTALHGVSPLLEPSARLNGSPLPSGCTVGTRLPFIQYVVSLGLVQAIRTETQQLLNAPGKPPGAWPSSTAVLLVPSRLRLVRCTSTAVPIMFTGLEVQIKWPNDLYYGTHKLGGILCQVAFSSKRFRRKARALQFAMMLWTGRHDILSHSGQLLHSRCTAISSFRSSLVWG